MNGHEMRRRPPLLLLPFVVPFLAAPAARDDSSEAPLPKEEAAARMSVPAGFEVQLFAGEPGVVQPIAFTFDERGRLWVVECLSYPDWKGPGEKGSDRVVILEDSDGDGRMDRRKLFWDEGRNLSGIELGFGGVWLCSTPELIFVPDRDGDDLPDGPPLALLDGWDLKAKHNVFNGLTWGPDGWLYGMNGILSNSKVGPPGAADDERVALNCGVWRFHPLERRFEVVAWGTTNPWGLDFDEHGEMFITNCVIPHVWHVMPGAHFQRMFGQDFNPHLYELMESCADHIHWAGGAWQESRLGTGKHGEAGGGHAHAGAMIYLGDNWPERWRGTLFTVNIHGRRLNNDFIERRGSGHVARHGKDFLFAGDPWFRGLEVKYGPDGGVFLSDWSDTGECHDYDHADRAHGRIYKITHPPLERVLPDLGRLSDLELVELQLHRNDWHARQARRLLQERAARGRDLGAAHRELRRLLEAERRAPRRLRALWALHASGGAGEELLLGLLGDGDEYLRAWAVRLLFDGESPPPAAMEALERAAPGEGSALVRLWMTSALQRLPLGKRWTAAAALAARGEDEHDRNLPLMLWYAVEPLVSADVERALALAREARIPLLRRFIARRAAASGEGLRSLVALLGRLERGDDAMKRDLLHGAAAALEGRRRPVMPSGWPAARRKLAASLDAEVRELTDTLAIAFGDPEALEAARRTALDPAAALSERSRALRGLVERREPDAPALLHRLLGDGALRSQALRALAAWDLPETAERIVERYGELAEGEKADAIGTLASRPAWALALIDAMESGRIARRDLSAFAARQVEALGDERVRARLKEVWGDVRPLERDKGRELARYRRMLVPEALEMADRSRGRLVYERACGSCHVLFDAGSRIGPDLTGSQRANLDYLLENLLDPNAIVGRDFQLTTVETRDGRLLGGIITAEDEAALVVQTPTERVVVPKAEVILRLPSEASMMPEGLLEPLGEEELRDLFGYLMGAEQAPRPASPAAHADGATQRRGDAEEAIRGE
jgi:putative membrane-bound dehydrogenase-like protein